MKWFKHKATANMDAKLQSVLLDHGLEGYGLYWYCVELIASEVEGDNLTFELEHDARIIARNTGSTVDSVNRIMGKFIELGLFEAESNIITCLKLAQVADDYTSKFIRKQPQVTDIKRVLQSPTNSDKNNTKESKLEEIKVLSKVEKFDYSAIVEIFNRVMIRSPKVVKLNEKRKRMVKNLFKFGDLDLIKFESYLSYLHSTPSWNWAFEKRTGANQIQYKECSFEYFMKEDTYLKAKEEI